MEQEPSPIYLDAKGKEIKLGSPVRLSEAGRERAAQRGINFEVETVRGIISKIDPRTDEITVKVEGSVEWNFIPEDLIIE